MKRWQRMMAALLAMALVSVEALANMAATSIPTTSRTDYVADNQDVAAVTEPLKKTEFYRIDKTDAFSIRITVFIGGKCRGDGFLQTDGLRRFDERIQHRGKYAAGGFVIFNQICTL